MAPSIVEGVLEGSTRVEGRSRPNLAEGCIRILAGDPGELIGSGGSDGSGRFSIPLVRPLVVGEIVRAVDVCDPFSAEDPLPGGLRRVVASAAVPALSSKSLLIAVIVLGAIASFAFRRRA
jgi:hypothetical protein